MTHNLILAVINFCVDKWVLRGWRAWRWREARVAAWRCGRWRRVRRRELSRLGRLRWRLKRAGMPHYSRRPAIRHPPPAIRFAAWFGALRLKAWVWWLAVVSRVGERRRFLAGGSFLAGGRRRFLAGGGFCKCLFQPAFPKESIWMGSFILQLIPLRMADGGWRMAKITGNRQPLPHCDKPAFLQLLSLRKGLVGEGGRSFFGWRKAAFFGGRELSRSGRLRRRLKRAGMPHYSRRPAIRHPPPAIRFAAWFGALRLKAVVGGGREFMGLAKGGVFWLAVVSRAGGSFCKCHPPAGFPEGKHLDGILHPATHSPSDGGWRVADGENHRESPAASALR